MAVAFLGEKEVILFQGDSVTDCGRNRDVAYSLGNGYPMIVSAYLSALFPKSDLVFINRGISGNRVCDLEKRWEEDCIGLKPTILSILIGINDTWRRYDSNDPTDVQSFESSYRNILKRVREQTEAKIILLEPFVLPVMEGQSEWREDLDPKIQAVRRLATEFADVYIPLDGIFATASVKKSAEFWTPDGVHPSNAGHGLIADAWIKAVT